MTQWRSAVCPSIRADREVGAEAAACRTASGHRFLTAWTRASSALYGGSPRGECDPGRLTRPMYSREAIHDLGGVEAKAHREAQRHARRGRRAEHEGDAGGRLLHDVGPAARCVLVGRRGGMMIYVDGPNAKGNHMGGTTLRSKLSQN